MKLIIDKHSRVKTIPIDKYHFRDGVLQVFQDDKVSDIDTFKHKVKIVHGYTTRLLCRLLAEKERGRIFRGYALLHKRETNRLESF